MPPSTATYVMTLRLTDSTLYSVTVEFATSARPGSSRTRLPGPASCATASTLNATYSSIVGGWSYSVYATPSPPPRLNIGKSPRSASAAIAGRNGASSTICEPMWKCRPSSSSLSEATTCAMALGAASRLKPTFVFGPPVEIEGWVSGLTPGAIRIWTAWRSPGATISSRRSMSRALSSTTWPTPASCASWSSRRDFALPWRWMRPGSKPAFSAMCSSPPPATSHDRPSDAMRRSTAVHANAFAAKWTSKSSVRAANASLNARTRARMSSSATTIAGVPNSRARSSASQPPSSRRPSSVRRLPIGYARESSRVSAAMQRRILPPRGTGDRPAIRIGSALQVIRPVAAAHPQLPAVLLRPARVGAGDVAADGGAGLARAAAQRERQRPRRHGGPADGPGARARRVDGVGRRQGRQAQAPPRHAGGAGPARARPRRADAHRRRAALDGVDPGPRARRRPVVRHADASGVRLRARVGRRAIARHRDQLDGRLRRAHGGPGGGRRDHRALRRRRLLRDQRGVVPRAALRPRGDGHRPAKPPGAAGRAARARRARRPRLRARPPRPARPAPDDGDRRDARVRVPGHDPADGALGVPPRRHRLRAAVRRDGRRRRPRRPDAGRPDPRAGADADDRDRGLRRRAGRGRRRARAGDGGGLPGLRGSGERRLLVDDERDAADSRRAGDARPRRRPLRHGVHGVDRDRRAAGRRDRRGRRAARLARGRCGRLRRGRAPRPRLRAPPSRRAAPSCTAAVVAAPLTRAGSAPRRAPMLGRIRPPP